MCSSAPLITRLAWSAGMSEMEKGRIRTVRQILAQYTVCEPMQLCARSSALPKKKEKGEGGRIGGRTRWSGDYHGF